MKRTINEKKAWMRIYFCTFLFPLILAYLISSVIDKSIFWSLVACLLIIINIAIMNYSFYSLGWEYKRISSHNVQKLPKEDGDE